MHPFGSHMLPGIFVGFAQNVGGLYNGDLFVVDWEDMAQAERASEIPIRRIKEKEVRPKFYGGKFRFPVKEGVLSQPLAPTRHRRPQ